MRLRAQGSVSAGGATCHARDACTANPRRQCDGLGQRMNDMMLELSGRPLEAPEATWLWVGGRVRLPSSIRHVAANGGTEMLWPPSRCSAIHRVGAQASWALPGCCRVRWAATANPTHDMVFPAKVPPPMAIAH
jgi:hypothetical protein